MKMLAEQLGGFRFNKALDLGVGIHPLLFSRKDEVRIAHWVSSRDAIARPGDGKPNDTHEISVPASPRGLFVVFGEYLAQADGDRVVLQLGNSGKLLLGTGEAPVYFRSAAPDPMLQIAAAWKRLPLEIVLDPKQTRIYADGLRNPWNHPISILLTGVSRDLQPHAECAVDHVLGPSRGQSVSAGFTLGLSNREVFSQSTRYVSASPIDFTVFPDEHRRAQRPD